MKHFKRLTQKNREAIINEIKLMLAAHRDCLWTRWESYSHAQVVDPHLVQIVCNEGYYGEAFGVVRSLAAIGYGYFGSDNMNAVQEGRSDVPEHNLKWFFSQIQKEYLDEEGYYEKSASAEKCAVLLENYRRLVRK